MRNLKKVLSLALALVMLIGMMVIGAGAVETKFVDDGKIGDNYKEAVAVMSAIKVLGGKENNNFDPEGTLTRAEAAKILCVMTMGSDAAEGLASVTKSGVFTDMADHWAAGYVDACYNKGIVLGMDVGIYGPSNTLTGTQFAAMLLRAMGVEGEFTGPSWESAVIAAAGKAKLSEVTTKPIARQAASKMAFDGLLYSPSGEKAYKVGNLTFDNFLEAYIAADQDVEKITVSTASDSLATTVFGLAEDAKTDAFGNPVKVWVYDDEDVVTLPGAAATLTFTKKMSASDLDKYTYADEAKLFVDGKETALKGTNDANDKAVVDESGNGIEVNVYATNKVISKVVAVKDYVDTVSAVTPARGDKERTITVGSLTYKTEEFEKGDVVLYTKAYNAESKKYEIKTVALAETVENVKVTSAKLTGDNVDSFSVDGEDYNFSSVGTIANKNDANLNNIVTLYLDSHGFVGKVVKVEGTSSDAYVLAIGNSNTIYEDGATYYAKLLLTDGSVVNQAEIAKATVDKYKNGQSTVSGIKGKLATALEKKIVSFTEVDDVYTLDAGTNVALVEDKDVTITNGRSAMTLDGNTLYANTNTIFLVKTGNSYASYTGFDEVPNLSADGAGNYAFARVGTSAVLSVIYLEEVDASNNDVIFLLKAGCDSKATNDSTGKYYNCAAVVNGEITTVKLSTTVKAGLDADKLYKSVSQDKNGIITGGKTYTAGTDYYAGEVTEAFENGVISIKDKGTFVVAEDATAYVCGDDIQGSDVGTIVEGDTVIFAVIKDGQITTVFYKEKATATTPEEPTEPTETGDVYVDVTTLGTIKVYTTKASLTTPEGVEAVLAKLKAEKYTIPADGEAGAPEIDENGDLVGKVIKNNIKYSFKWDVGSNTEVSGKAIKLDGKNIIVAKTVDTIAGVTGVAKATQYVRYRANATASWSYGKTDFDKTGSTVATGTEIETGYYKVQVASSNPTAAALDLTASKIVETCYAKGTDHPVKATNANGTGFKVNDGTDDNYFAWAANTTYADIYKKCGASAAGVIDMTVAQVKFTIYDDSVNGKGEKTEISVDYNASEADLSATIDASNKGTMMYVGNKEGTAVVDTTAIKANEDKTFYIGYVKVGSISDTTLTGMSIERKVGTTVVTTDSVIKNGDTLVATITFGATSVVDAKDTVACGSSATCDITGLTLTGETDKSTSKTTESNGTVTFGDDVTKVTGSMTASYTIGATNFSQAIVATANA